MNYPSPAQWKPIPVPTAVRLPVNPEIIDDPAYDVDKFVHMMSKNTMMLSDTTATDFEVIRPKTENVGEDLIIEKVILVHARNRREQEFLIIPLSYLIEFDEGKVSEGLLAPPCLRKYLSRMNSLK